MALRSIPRRAMLATLIAGVGCLERSTPPAEREGDLSPPDDLVASAETATFAHWFEPHADPVGEAIRATLPPSVEITFDVYGGRREQERAVAAGLVDGSPPDCFQSVLGAELERYVDAVTVHAIPDIVDEESLSRLRQGVRSLVGVGGAPYAVPVTLDRTNGVFVHPKAFGEIGIDPHALTHPGALVEALGGLEAETGWDGLVLPETGASVFRLFCVLVAGEAGIAGYDGLVARDIPAVELRSAADRLSELLEVTTFASDGGSAPAHYLAEEAAMIPASSSLVTHLSTIDPTPLPFPGTAGQFLLHATGWTFPKRTRSPVGTAAVLTGLNTAECQAAVAQATHTIPAIQAAEVDGESAYVTAVAEQLAAATSVRPAISTGCGIDPDLRRRAIQALDPPGVKHETAEALGDELLELFR